MDAFTELLAETGVNLAQLALKGTVSAVNTKIKTIKTEKNIEVLKNNYDAIVNELLSEREEAIRIAQLYKSEIDKIEISDQDIEHLHNTVKRVLEIFKDMSPLTPTGTFEQIQELINIDTLKTMQLLGFNYKKAIGEPLTELCANAIFSKAKQSDNKPINQNNSLNKPKH